MDVGISVNLVVHNGLGIHVMIFVINSPNQIDTHTLILNINLNKLYYGGTIRAHSKKEIIFNFLRSTEAKCIRDTTVKTRNTPS